MKVMKAKRVSKIASGRFAKSRVLSGQKVKTSGGLTRSSLIKNKRGKVVSKKASAVGRKQFKNIKSWFEACQKARKELKIKGFVAIGGKTQLGKAFYSKAKSIFNA